MRHFDMQVAQEARYTAEDLISAYQMSGHSEKFENACKLLRIGVQGLRDIGASSATVSVVLKNEFRNAFQGRSGIHPSMEMVKYDQADASPLQWCRNQLPVWPIAPAVDHIVFSGDKTIVFWKDGTKTMVSCMEGQAFDEYSGFVAALAKKLYGSTSQVKKLVKKTGKNQNAAIQKRREKKALKKALNEKKEG